MSDKTLSRVPEKSDHHFPEQPPVMRRVTKIELVWPGKYNEGWHPPGIPRVSLPFQLLRPSTGAEPHERERSNSMSIATRGKTTKQSTLFDIWEHKEEDTFEAGWKNKLIWGDTPSGDGVAVRTICWQD